MQNEFLFFFLIKLENNLISNCAVIRIPAFFKELQTLRASQGFWGPGPEPCASPFSGRTLPSSLASVFPLFLWVGGTSLFVLRAYSGLSSALGGIWPVAGFGSPRAPPPSPSPPAPHDSSFPFASPRALAAVAVASEIFLLPVCSFSH